MFHPRGTMTFITPVILKYDYEKASAPRPRLGLSLVYGYVPNQNESSVLL